MLSEQKLRELEAVTERVGSVYIPPDTLRQLIAAARVANAMARLEREERENPAIWCNGHESVHPHMASARAALALALRRYTAAAPRGEVTR